MTEQCESPLRYDIVDVRQTGGGSNVRVLYMVVPFYLETMPLAAHVERLYTVCSRIAFLPPLHLLCSVTLPKATPKSSQQFLGLVTCKISSLYKFSA